MISKKEKNIIKFVLGAVFIGAVFVFFTSSFPIETKANEIDQLRNKIDQHQGAIQSLEKDIERYKKEIQNTTQEKQSLQQVIDGLSATQKKLEAELSITQNQIQSTSLTIEEIDREISETEEKVFDIKDTIGETLRDINESDQMTLVEAVFRYESLDEAWRNVSELNQLQRELGNQIDRLDVFKNELKVKRDSQIQEKNKLVNLKEELDDREQVVAYNKSEKDTLLKQTESEEARYRELLAEKEAARIQIENEIRDFEAQLEYILDTESLPSKGSGVLAWPLDSVRVTQGFGLTPFALSGAYGYTNGSPNPHRGIDFGATTGTPVRASTSGTVRAKENMDAFPGCISYGQWILVDHDNGLSTMYSHLSVMSVNPGQRVERGEIIGYSGNSGFSTGPHLDFRVFVRDAVQVQKFINSKGGCREALVPIAPLNTYLDPFDYLP